MTALISLEKRPESKLADTIKDDIYALYENLKGKKEFRNTIIGEVQNNSG